MSYEHIKTKWTEPTGPVEHEPWFDRRAAEYSASQMDKSDKKVTGSIWDVQFMSSMDGVLHFATVLKIDDGDYRFFHSEEEAIAQRVLRGLPDIPPTIRYKTGTQITRPGRAVKIVGI